MVLLHSTREARPPYLALPVEEIAPTTLANFGGLEKELRFRTGIFPYIRLNTRSWMQLVMTLDFISALSLHVQVKIVEVTSFCL